MRHEGLRNLATVALIGVGSLTLADPVGAEPVQPTYDMEVTTSQVPESNDNSSDGPLDSPVPQLLDTAVVVAGLAYVRKNHALTNRNSESMSLSDRKGMRTAEILNDVAVAAVISAVIFASTRL